MTSWTSFNILLCRLCIVEMELALIESFFVLRPYLAYYTSSLGKVILAVPRPESWGGGINSGSPSPTMDGVSTTGAFAQPQTVQAPFLLIPVPLPAALQYRSTLILPDLALAGPKVGFAYVTPLHWTASTVLLN